MNCKQLLRTAVFCACILLTGVCIANAATYNVMSYGATGNGTTDDTTAIQNCVNAAITAGSGNEVYFPAGTYYVPEGPINVYNATNLTVTGASSTTTYMYLKRGNAQAFWFQNDTGTIFENFAIDVGYAAGSTTQHDLAFTQGTITAINAAANQVTVSVESGYPLLSRSDLLDTYQGGGITGTFWTFSDPLRPDNWDNDSQEMTGEAATGSPSGSTGTITLSSIPANMYVGERWEIWSGWISNACVFNYNTNITATNINEYGGGIDWGASGNHNTGVTISNYYIGPPPYQSDRLVTCYQSMAWNQQNRGLTTFNNCNFSGSWDDALDTQASGQSEVVSQTNSTQIVASTNYYLAGDEIKIFSQNPTNVYATDMISTVVADGSNYLLTLSSPVTILNPGSDQLIDVTSLGSTLIENSQFTSQSRRVLLSYGLSSTVKNCTFYDDNLCALGIGGFPTNDLIEDNTFIGCESNCIDQNGGYDSGPATAGGGVTITGNTFEDSGYAYGPATGEPIFLSNLTGLTISNNWFDTNWGANVALQYDANVSITGNTFLHPNEINPIWANTAPDDTSVVWLTNVAGVNLANNIVSGAGPFTAHLAEAAANVTSATGLTDGITQVDNPLAFYLNYDAFVMEDPTGATILDQAAWNESGSQETQRSLQKWLVTPDMASMGNFTLTNDYNGQFVGTSGSTTLGADISLENQAWTSGNPTNEQLWNLGWIDSNDNNIDNVGSGYCVNVLGGSSTSGAQLGQWYTGNVQNQNFYSIAPPYLIVQAGGGAMTLSWAPSSFATSYSVGRSTVSGGPYTTLVSGISATAYYDTSVTAGTTYYYQVTAAGLPIGYGRSNEAFGAAAAATSVNLTSYYNHAGIYNEGATYGSGFDGSGYAFSSALIPSPFVTNNSLFTLGPVGSNDVVFDAGQTIPVTSGSYDSLQILVASPGFSSVLTLTLNYSDGSTVSYAQDVNNWCNLGNAINVNEDVSLTMAHRLYNNGTDQSTTCYIYECPFAVNPAKTLKSITLSNTGNNGIFAMSLTSPTFVPVNLAPNFNVIGIEPDSWNYQGTGFDGDGYTYSGTLLGNKINWDGAWFNLGIPSRYNTISDSGQRIVLPNGNFSQMLILGATPGSSGALFTPSIIYTDGNVVPLSQGMTNWCASASQSGEYNAYTMSYRDDSGGTNGVTCYVHGYVVPVDPTQTAQWLDLTNTGNFRILAIDMLTGMAYSKTLTSTALTSSVNPSTYSSSVTFTATVSPNVTNGDTVTFYNGSASIGTGSTTNGVATLTTAALPAGSLSITAAFAGDGSYSASTSSVLTQTVNKEGTTTSLSTSANPSKLGASVTFTATVSPSVPNGETVTFYNGASSIGTGTTSSGVATLSTTSLPAGSLSITAKYAGDSNYVTSTSSVLTQTVAGPVQVSLTSYFNLTGIVTDGSTFSGGMDGSGTALSSNLLGTSQTWSSETFTIGAAGGNNVVTTTGQSITLPSGPINYSHLYVLADAVNGSQTSQTLSVGYTTGSASNFTQSFSDWANPQSYTGESEAVTMSYRDTSTGGRQTASFYTYGYVFAIDNTRAANKLTLPSDSNLKIITVTLAP